MRLVVGACGPRQRSTKSPFVYRLTRRHGRVGRSILDEVLDQLDLVILALAHVELERIADGHVVTYERLVGG